MLTGSAIEIATMITSVKAIVIYSRVRDEEPTKLFINPDCEGPIEHSRRSPVLHMRGAGVTQRRCAFGTRR